MIDLGWLGQIAFTWEFFVAVMSIVLIDLVLAGDNAVVIAMAVKNLPGKDRQMGIILGSGGAVVIRVICTFLVAQLLNMSFVKLVGGAVIIWIAVKLLTEGTKEECHGQGVRQHLAGALDHHRGGPEHGHRQHARRRCCQPRQPVPAALRPAALHPLGGVHEHLALQADGPVPDHPVDRCGSAGQGGRRNDDHRSLGERAAQPAQVGRVCRDGLLRYFYLCVEQMDDHQPQEQGRP